MAYPTSGPATFLSLGGACPSTHPVRIPQLMYEVVWDTTKFNSLWATGDPNPFYLSTGDNTGYGQHADYVFGWKGNALQSAMDTSGCELFQPQDNLLYSGTNGITGMGAKCAQLKTQSIDAAKACSVKTVVNENHEGCRSLF